MQITQKVHIEFLNAHGQNIPLLLIFQMALASMLTMQIIACRMTKSKS